MDLFNAVVTLSGISGGAELTKTQKAFNRLVRQIEGKRARLAAWEEIAPRFQRTYGAEMLPRLARYRDLCRSMALALDDLAGRKGFGKRDQARLADLILDLAGSLAEEENCGEEMKALYNKYSGHFGMDYDDQQAARNDMLKTMMEDSLGVELGDDLDMSSPEAIMARLREVMEEERRRAAETPSKRRRSAKAQAREQQRQVAAEQASQSVRDVYRKLASALHPDREPDPAERSRKTTLMQRVNQAYEKGNLLQLLELQLELEHIDQASLAAIGEERLGHYNAVLKEQLSELDQEIARVEFEFAQRFGILTHRRLEPGRAMAELKQEIARLDMLFTVMDEDLRQFQDVRSAKTWLREMPLRPWMSQKDIPF